MDDISYKKWNVPSSERDRNVDHDSSKVVVKTKNSPCLIFISL